MKVRGTEPRLTHTTLDGITIASPETVRRINFDLVPANLVVCTNQRNTAANMEADGMAGAGRYAARKVQKFIRLFCESTGGYMPIIGGRPAYQFDGTLGKRFLEGNKLGALFSASYDWNGRGLST